jgi:hypothetical protein
MDLWPGDHARRQSIGDAALKNMAPGYSARRDEMRGEPRPGDEGSRREFLRTIEGLSWAGAAAWSGLLGSAAAFGLPSAAVAAEANDSPTSGDRPRKKIAIVATIWAYLSHGQHMGDRFLVGWPEKGDWHDPQVEVVAVYVDQKPDSDLSERRAAKHGFKVYPSIAEALRCGTDRLAVDGVVIIGEHGDYPQTPKGQTMWPRYEFFQQVVKVFEEEGRGVPVFNDKHLSYSWKNARKMVADSKRLKFPFLAGSSIPVTWRLPAVEVPYGEPMRQAMAVGAGDPDGTAFHALEGLQCMVERRKGGETGIKSVQMLEGPAVWKAGEDGLWSRRLLQAALSRSDTVHGLVTDGSLPQELVESGEIQKIVVDPRAYLIERRDGLQTCLLMLDELLHDFLFAGEMADGKIVSTQFYLPPEPNVVYSSRLMAGVERMIVSGEAPYPIERTELTSCILDRCLDSRAAGQRRLDTPELDIAYTVPRDLAYGAP